MNGPTSYTPQRPYYPTCVTATAATAGGTGLSCVVVVVHDLLERALHAAQVLVQLLGARIHLLAVQIVLTRVLGKHVREGGNV